MVPVFLQKIVHSVFELYLYAMGVVLLKASGLGRMKPNILMMGFKKNWRASGTEDLMTYVGVLQ